MRDFMSNMRFMMLWILGMLVALFAAGVVSTIILLLGSVTAVAIWGEEVATANPASAFLFIVIFLSTIGLMAGWIFGSIQKMLLRSRTNEPWRGWIFASIIGGIIGIDVTVTLLMLQASQYIIWLVIPPPETLFWVGLQVAIIPIGCLSLAQMVVLWRHVYGAWTWVLANIVAGLAIFSLIVAGAASWAVTPLWSLFLGIVIVGTPGIVTGFAMVWLIQTNWRHRR